MLIAMNHDSYGRLSLEQMSRLVKKDGIVCDIWNLFGTGKIIFPVNGEEIPQWI